LRELLKYFRIIKRNGFNIYINIHISFNLSIIHQIVKQVKRDMNIDIDIESIPFNDPKVFQLLSQGDTTGVFQLESDGIRNVLKKLQPEQFEDIVAVTSLY